MTHFYVLGPPHDHLIKSTSDPPTIQTVKGKTFVGVVLKFDGFQLLVELFKDS